MPPKSILIQNGYVLTLNSKREIIKQGSIYIEGDTISEIGRSEELRNYKADLVIDAKNKIVMPGLVDTHTHLR